MMNLFIAWRRYIDSVGAMLVWARSGGKEKGMVLVFSVVKDEPCVYSFRQRDLTRLTTSTGSYLPTSMAYATTRRRPALGGI